MNNHQFISSLTSIDVATIIFFQFLSFLMIFSLIKRKQVNVIDPLTLNIFLCSSSFSVVGFIYINLGFSNFILFSFIASNIAYFSAYYFFAINKNNLLKTRKYIYAVSNWKLFERICLHTAILYIIFNILSIYIFGFGLSHDNRQTIYLNSGGLGIIKRVIDATFIPTVLYFTYIFSKNKVNSKRLALLGFSIILIFASLDGSKSGLLYFFITFIMCNQFLKTYGVKTNIIISKFTVLIILSFSVLLAVLVLSIQYNIFNEPERFFDVFSVLLYRIILATDIYVNGFPGDLIDSIKLNTNPFLILFKDVLSFFRFNLGKIEPLGNILANRVGSGPWIDVGGPNAGHSIYGYYLFGTIGAVLFSFIFGIFTGLVRTKLNFAHHHTPVCSLLYFVLFFQLVIFILDPSFMMSRLTNFTFIFLPIYFLNRLYKL